MTCLNTASRHLPGGAKETPQNVTQDSQCHNWDSKPKPLNMKQASQLQDLEIYSVAQSVVVGSSGRRKVRRWTSGVGVASVYGVFRRNIFPESERLTSVWVSLEKRKVRTETSDSSCGR